jgi:hypothetical protein
MGTTIGTGGTRTNHGAGVIPYAVNDGRDNPQSYRPFTTILDRPRPPPRGLAGAYTQRREIELAFNELETPNAAPPHHAALKVPERVPGGDLGTPVLPLRDPTLMAGAASHSGRPGPNRFVAALRITRQTIPHRGAFCPATRPRPSAPGCPSYGD